MIRKQLLPLLRPGLRFFSDKPIQIQSTQPTTEFNEDLKDSNVCDFPQRPTLDFGNSQKAFQNHSTKELWRTHFVLRICGIESLVKRSEPLMKAGDKILGSYFMNKLLSPLCNQFVAGESVESIRSVAERLSRLGINVIVTACLESDVGESKTGYDIFEANLKKTLQSIEISSKVAPKSINLRPMCLIKMTGHFSPTLLYNISAVYINLTSEKRRLLVDALSNHMDKILKTKNFDKLSLPGLDISAEDLMSLEECLPRVVEIGSLAKKLNVILPIDAEFSYVNPAISLLALALMKIFNDQLPVIWNTYQAYLKESMYWLDHDLELIQSLGVSFGVKIVRGAYMEREKEYAKIHNLTDPVNESYQITSNNYDSLINMMFPLLASVPQKYQIIVATHNEASILKSVNQMQQKNLPNSTPAVLFGQQYGMADNISFPLAASEYSIYKVIPFGCISEVIPYLARRAHENKDVLRGSRREMALVYKELNRRIRTTLI